MVLAAHCSCSQLVSPFSYAASSPNWELRKCRCWCLGKDGSKLAGQHAKFSRHLCNTTHKHCNCYFFYILLIIVVIFVLSCCDFKLTEDAGVFNVKAEKSFCVIQTFTVTPEHCEAHKSKCIYFKDNISTAVTVCSLACCTKGRFLEEKIHPCSLPNRVLSVCLAS